MDHEAEAYQNERCAEWEYEERQTEVAMRVREDDFIVPCACRTPGECTHNHGLWKIALDKLVDQFADAMKTKLTEKAVYDGKTGWDDPAWTPEQITQAMRDHIDKGDPVDVANFAAFLWNRQ